MIKADVVDVVFLLDVVNKFDISVSFAIIYLHKNNLCDV